MSDRLVLSIRADADLADESRLPFLSARALGDQVALPGPAKEIDVEVGRHRERTGCRPSENTTTYMAKSASAIMVGPEIVPPGRIWPRMIGLAHPRRAEFHMLDRQPAARIEHLREFARRGGARVCSRSSKAWVACLTAAPSKPDLRLHGVRSDTMPTAAKTVQARPKPRDRPAARRTSTALRSCSRSTGRQRATPCRRPCSRRCRATFAAIAADKNVRAVVLCRQRPGFLRRPRSEGDHRASQRPRRRPRLFPRHHGDAAARMMQPIMQAAAAGHRRGRGRRDRGGLPAGRKLRPRGRVDDRALRDAGRRISGCSARRRWWRCRATSPRKHAMEMLLTGDIDLGRGRLPHRPGQSRRAGRHERRAGARAGAQDRGQIAAAPSKIGKEAFYRQRRDELRRRLSTMPSR